MSPTESKSNPSTSIYLYGAAVQGIQGFIFQTNELKDIVGASELVEEICTKMFENEFKQDGELIVSAAGNIKCLFYSEAQCKKAVLLFPKMVMEAAPGITISQAVVETTQEQIDSDFQSVVDKLESRLHAQRNRACKSITTGLMGIERSRRTGLPAVKVENDDFLDSGTAKKKERAGGSTLNLAKKSFGNDQLRREQLAFDIEKLTDRNDWIAIIHADGNGLGEILASKGGDRAELKEFSSKLSEATITAAQKTFKELPQDAGKIIPIRPVVLGGDDMTVICRADIAVTYTLSFLIHFEEETKLRGFPLTACAGIAFIKSSYPFHYGYDLAEMLCGRAKKDAKSRKVDGLAPSCLMFHKVQSSFVENYDEIVMKELTPCTGHSFEFGPYYINPQDNRWTIDELLKHSFVLIGKNKNENKDGNATKSDIRNWMSLMHKDIGEATQRKKRVLQLTKGDLQKTFENATKPIVRDGIKCYPAYDILSISTIVNLQTK
jgi:hypothetical protein